MFEAPNDSHDPMRRIAEAVISVVDNFIVTYSDRLIEMAVHHDKGELKNTRHRGNFLSKIDLELHSLYATEMAKILPSFIYASEEGEPQKYPVNGAENPAYVVIVDPLDTSELAVRGLHGYTQLIIFSVVEQRPVVAVVGDMFHDVRIFYAYYAKDGKDRAFLRTRGGVTREINSSQETRLNNAFLPQKSIIVDDSQCLSYFVKEAASHSTVEIEGSMASHIGWALPAALGVKIAQPERLVVAVVSDGSTLFSLSALPTIASLRLPILIIVANNRSAMSLRLEAQAKALLSDSTLSPLNWSGTSFNFAAAALAFGIPATQAITVTLRRG